MVCQGSAEGGSAESESGGSGAERRLLAAGFAGNETGSIGRCRFTFNFRTNDY